MPLKNSGIHIGNTTASLSNFLASTKSAISSLKEEILYHRRHRLCFRLYGGDLESRWSTRPHGTHAGPDGPQAPGSQCAARRPPRYAASTISSWQERPSAWGSRVYRPTLKIRPSHFKFLLWWCSCHKPCGLEATSPLKKKIHKE